MTFGGSLVARVRAVLLQWVLAGTPTVARFQRACGVTSDGPTSWLLHPIFSIGGQLGNETFFILFLPWMQWDFDAEVGRKTVTTWMFIQYFGQVIKDLLELPRPARAGVIDAAGLAAAWRFSRPSKKGARALSDNADGTWGDAHGVMVLEPFYAAEYGMPSTHAMNAVGLPWATFAHAALSGRYSGSLSVLFVCALAFTLSCTLSRLYLGVHSPADVIVGLALGAAITALDIFLLDAPLNAWLLNSQSAPWAVPAALALAMVLYPKPAKWRPSPGHTALVVGGGGGLMWGTALMPPSLRDVLLRPRDHFSLPTSLVSAAGMAPRLLVGWAVCLGARAVMKPLCIFVLELALGPAYATAEEVAAEEVAWGGSDTPAHLCGPHPTFDESPVAEGAAGGSSSSISSAAAASSSSISSAAAASSSSVSSSSSGGSSVRRRGHVAVGYDDMAAARAASAASSEVPPGELRIRTSAAAATGGAKDASGAGAAAASTLVRVPPGQRYAVELPTKLIVYTCVGLGSQLARLVFQMLSIAAVPRGEAQGR